MDTAITRPPQVGTHRYITLDGMRGIAAILVMLMHFTSGTSLAQVGSLTLFKLASLAVDFFFMLSGFVLAHAYAQRLREGYSGLAYMRQRVLRLYPMLLFGTLIGMVFVWLVTGQGGVPLEPGLFAKAAALNLLFLPVFHHSALPGYASQVMLAGHITLFNPPAWSLFFEMVASLTFIVMARANRRLVAVLTAASFLVMTALAWQESHRNGFGGLTYFGGTTHDSLWAGFPRVLYGFYVGVVIYAWQDRLAALVDRLPAVLLSPWTLYAVLAAMLIFPLALHGIYPALVLLVFGPALVALGARSTRMSVMTARISHGLGWLSYPLYCVHFPIAELVWMLGARWHWSVLEMTVLASVCAVAGACALGHFLEQPVKMLLMKVLPKPA